MHPISFTWFLEILVNDARVTDVTHTWLNQHRENIQINGAYSNITMTSIRTTLNNTQNIDATSGK
jgi:hypothetical protein